MGMLRLLETFAKSMKEEGFTPPLHIQLCMSDWIALLTEAGRRTDARTSEASVRALTRETVEGVELLRYSAPPTSRLELVVDGHVVCVSPAPGYGL